MADSQTSAALRDLAPTNDTFIKQGCRALVLSDIENIVSAPTSDTTLGETNIVGIVQSPDEIKFALKGYCDVYFSPSSDSTVLHNTSLQPFLVTSADDAPSRELKPRGTCEISHGQRWTLVRATDDRSPIATIHILPRPESTLSIHSELSNQQPEASKKRMLTQADFDSPQDRKRTKVLGPGYDGRVAVVADRVQAGNPLLALQPGETITTADPSVYSLTMDGVAGSGRNAFTTKIGTHSAPQSKVIVKVLTKNAANAVDIIQGARQWLREKTIMASLQHENLTRLHSSDARFHTLFIEYEDATDLSRNVDEQGMFAGSFPDVANILLDLLQGLAYMHQKNILHNDLKPENMLRTREGRTIICDFGLTTNHPSNDRGGGTPYYLAPETIMSGVKTHATDVWALGICMLFFLGRIALPDRQFKELHWIINKAMAGDKIHLDRARAYSREIWTVVGGLRQRLQHLPQLEPPQSNLERALLEVTLKMLDDEPKNRPDADLLLSNAVEIHKHQSAGSEIIDLRWPGQEAVEPQLPSGFHLESSAGSTTQPLPTSMMVGREEEKKSPLQ